MTAALSPSPPPANPRARAARGLQTAAAALLILCLSARAFLGEMPFRTSSLKLPATRTAARQEGETTPFLNRSDFARATFACLLLLAGALWCLAGTLSRERPLGPTWLVGVVVAFLVLSALSAVVGTRRGADARTAWLVYVEQAGLMVGALVAMRVFRGRRRFALLVTVAAALGAVLAVKGIWQEAVERPERVEHFLAYRDEQLTRQGIDPNSPQAQMLETRLRSRGALGYFALANPFGSLLVVLLGAGVAVVAAKLGWSAKRRRADKPGMKPGEIHVPTLAAWLTVLACTLTAAGLLLTRSRGAVGAAVAVAVVGALLWRLRGWMQAHWRLATAGVGAVLAAGLLTVAGYGLARDRLPSKTMTFRWYYWTGTAKVIAERPWVGVGPGSFPDAYLRHRRPAAEESIKNPHNMAMHALAQYGWPGGMCYLVVLVGLAVLAFRPPRRSGEQDGDEPASDQRPPNARPPSPADKAGQAGKTAKRSHPGRTKARRAPREGGDKQAPSPAAVPRADRLLMFLPIPAMIVGRAMFTESGASGLLFMVDTLLPACVLAVMLVAFSWAGQRRLVPLSPVPVRWLVAAGLAGFVVHNLVTFSLWMPGAATAFWLLAGACAGCGEEDATPQAGTRGNLPSRKRPDGGDGR